MFLQRAITYSNIFMWHIPPEARFLLTTEPPYHDGVIFILRSVEMHTL